MTLGQEGVRRMIVIYYLPSRVSLTLGGARKLQSQEVDLLPIRLSSLIVLMNMVGQKHRGNCCVFLLGVRILMPRH